MNRIKKAKRFAILVLCSTVAAFTFTGCATHQPEITKEKADLVIMHTNDTHSYIAGIDKNGNYCTDDKECRGGLARISAAIKNAKAKNDNVIALDAGDMFQGTLFFSVNKWKMIADLNKLMPYDATTLGNHEWDYGCKELADYIDERSFPILAANLTPEKECPLSNAKYQPYVIKEIGGHKVGVIGISHYGVVKKSGACEHTKFSDAKETIERTIKQLEEQDVNRILLVTHIGLSEDIELARKIDGIDVIIGGHSHSYLGPDSKEGPYPIVEKSPNGNPVLVVTAKKATQYIGELAVNFDEKGIPASWSGSARELLPNEPRDEAVSAKISEYAKKIEPFQKNKVGSHNLTYNDGADECREDECLTGMLFADAMLEFARTYGAKIALVNSGRIRAALKPGEISQGDILTAFPYGDTVILRELTGKQIRKALEYGVSKKDAKGSILLQIAGLRYAVDASKPKGKRILSAEIVNEKNLAVPLKMNKLYVVAMQEYIANGGRGFSMLKKGKRVSVPNVKDADILSDYLKKHSPMQMPITGRIIRK